MTAPEAGAEHELEVVEAARGRIEQVRRGDARLWVADAGGRAVPQARVQVSMRRHRFLFGCNFFAHNAFEGVDQNREYDRRFADLFNMAVVPVYWRRFEKVRGRPDYDHLDEMVDWGLRHHLVMKAHPLVWLAPWPDKPGIPEWLPVDDEKSVLAAIRDRIADLVTRYRGKITLYDVVNEPVCGKPEMLKKTPLHDYVSLPLAWTRQADPAATLLVNDFYVLHDGRQEYRRFLADLVEWTAPVDGIGIQAHEPRTERFPLDRVERILDDYAQLGLPLHITEFTPTSGGQPITGSWKSGQWDEAEQAEYVERFYTVVFSHPAVVSINFWDLCESRAWLEGGGLLRKDLSPKPAYDALLRLVRREWWTDLSDTTDTHGHCAFNGFFGTYHVTAKWSSGRTAEGDFELVPGGDNTWTLTAG